MAWSAEQIKQAVSTIVPPDQSTRYWVEGDHLIAAWHFDAGWLGVDGGGAENRDYRFVVTLDAAKGEFSTDEQSSSGELGGHAGPDGVSFGGEKSAFKGHQSSKSFEFGAAPKVRSSHAETGQSFAYRFDSEKVKAPLLGLLNYAGWTQHRGFLGKIFGG